MYKCIINIEDEWPEKNMPNYFNIRINLPFIPYKNMRLEFKGIELYNKPHYLEDDPELAFCDEIKYIYDKKEFLIPMYINYDGCDISPESNTLENKKSFIAFMLKKGFKSGLY